MPFDFDENNIPDVLRKVARYAELAAVHNGGVNVYGFTTFHALEDNPSGRGAGTGRQLRVFLFPGGTATHRDFTEAALGFGREPGDKRELPRFVRNAFRIVGSHLINYRDENSQLYVGFPSFHKSNESWQVVMFPRQYVTIEKRVSFSVLGIRNEDRDNIPEIFRRVAGYAEAKNCFGFTTFLGYRDNFLDVVMLPLSRELQFEKAEGAPGHVLKSVLDICMRFQFDPECLRERENELLRAHIRAIARLQRFRCTSLSDEERSRILADYERKNIFHYRIARPGINGEAVLNGHRIGINFEVLFPQGADEIAQTVLHEMTHCVGYAHPERAPTDQPNDGGGYYNSVPLRAELCIAGRQSLRDECFSGEQHERSCVHHGDHYELRRSQLNLSHRDGHMLNNPGFFGVGRVGALEVGNNNGPAHNTRKRLRMGTIE